MRKFDRLRSCATETVFSLVLPAQVEKESLSITLVFSRAYMDGVIDSVCNFGEGGNGLLAMVNGQKRPQEKGGCDVY